MFNFNEDAIREAAYYIWKNNGCPSNSNLSDWDAAINQLSTQAALKLKAPKKASAIKVLMPKKTTSASSKKAASLHGVQSIILKPASAFKISASSSKKTAVKTTKSTTKKTTAKKAK